MSGNLQNDLEVNVKHIKMMFVITGSAGILFYITSIVIGFLRLNELSKRCLLFILFVIIMGTVLEVIALTFLDLYKQVLDDMSRLYDIEMRSQNVMRIAVAVSDEDDKNEVYKKLADSVLKEETK